MRSSYTREFNFSKYIAQVEDVDPIFYVGSVSGVEGLEILSRGPCAKIGEICNIMLPDGKKLMAEVVGLDGTTVKLTAFGTTDGIEVGCEVVGTGSPLQVPVGMNLLGRTIDAAGKAYDGLGEIVPDGYYPALLLTR